MSHRALRRLASATLAALTVFALTLDATPASAGEVPLTARARGIDVSYPQCGSTLPTSADFAVVGVDGGRPFDANPCLADQIAWARTFGKPSYYANTANPGPRLSDHWPIGQRTPRRCTRRERNSEDCAFDYGFNAAKDSFRRAQAAARSIGARSVADSVWWLDVEMHNTWQSLEYGERPKLLRNDTAVLAGMIKLLHRRGVRWVGVYSTMHQWQRITGGARLGRAPIWYAGTGTIRSARVHCRPRYSFTGGPIRMAQFLRDGFDADLRC